MKPARGERRYAVFAQEYAKHHNATRAAITAGYSPKSANSQGSRLLTHAKVLEILSALEAKALEQAGIDTVALLRESKRIGFSDPRKLFHPDGRPKQPHELDDDTAAAVCGIERMVEYRESVGKNGKPRKQRVVTFRYKLLDKNPTHERLFKHKGLFKQEVLPPLPGDIEVEEVSALDLARRIAFILVVGARHKKEAASGKRK